MLIKCPECDLQVSDKALVCPHCGYPMKPEAKVYSNKKSKRMRLPNGFGQISELKNRNLRKPFRAMVSVGTNPDTGRPIVKLLQPEAYFETYNDAYAALVTYNKDPYDLDGSMTMSELYDQWFEMKSQEISNSAQRMYSSSWKYCTSVYKVSVKELKISQIKACLENGSVIKKDGSAHMASSSTQKSIKILFNLLLDYAVENGLVEKNVARQYITHNKKTPTKHHIAFAEEELEILWKNINRYGVDLILIQCYTGLRPQEIGLIETNDCNNNCIVGGIKTEAGKNRLVPIHSKIQSLVENKYKEAIQLNSKYLFNYTQSKDGRTLKSSFLSYERYKDLFLSIMSDLNLNSDHKPHDGRATFATLAKKYNMDEYALKRIIGHHIEDLTERVYTTRDIDWLRAEIEKIK